MNFFCYDVMGGGGGRVGTKIKEKVHESTNHAYVFMYFL